MFAIIEVVKALAVAARCVTGRHPYAHVNALLVVMTQVGIGLSVVSFPYNAYRYISMQP